MGKEERRLKKVILTTGGTGGHIYPAIAVADALTEKGIECIFVGTKHRMEKELIGKSKYKFIGLDIVPVTPKNPISILKMLWAIIDGLLIIGREKPTSIIGFGNYISVPMLMAGLITRKELFLQEQNANLGIANKLFYKFADKMYLAFEKTYDERPLKYYKKLEVTGNPLRKEVYSVDRNIERTKLKVEADEKILLITGGSLGAKSINEALLKNWQKTLEEKKIRIYWATGTSNFEEINNKISKYKANDVIKPYFNNMPEIMEAADFVICRAGALTISEIIEQETPAILIPYQSIKVGQYENAKILEEVGGAYIHKNSEADIAISRAFELIKDDKKLLQMKAQLKTLKRKNAAERIAEDIDKWGK